MRLFSRLAFLALPACGTLLNAEDAQEFDDEGVLCVGDRAPDDDGNVVARLTSDDSARVHVVLGRTDHCELNVLDSSCEAVWDGASTVTVHAHARIAPYSSDTSCDVPISVVCDTEPLPDGFYRFRLGDEMYEREVPSTVAGGCNGEAPDSAAF